LRLKVALHIDPEHVGADTTVGLVALRLIQLGGSFTGWKPNAHRLPAVASFDFATAHERDEFVARALGIAGVSLAESTDA
jgi:hypothetical protein